MVKNLNGTVALRKGSIKYSGLYYILYMFCLMRPPHFYISCLTFLESVFILKRSKLQICGKEVVNMIRTIIYVNIIYVNIILTSVFPISVSCGL